MYTQTTFFQKAAQNDAQHTPVVAPMAIPVNATPVMAIPCNTSDSPEKLIYRNFAEEIAAQRPDVADQTCFILHAQESTDVAERLGENLENAGVEIRLDTWCERENRAPAEYVHELVLSKNCKNVLVISDADFLHRCEEYAKNEKGRQYSNDPYTLEKKQFRYVVKASKQGVNVFEVQREDCGNTLDELLKTQPDERFYLYEFPERLTTLQLIRAIYALPQQDKVYRKLKEEINSIPNNKYNKEEYPIINSPALVARSPRPTA